MAANLGHPGLTGRNAAQANRPRAQTEPQPATDPVDWRSVRQAEHACCCLARPAVIAVMPATAIRPHATDLLLCGHHYRMCGRGLSAAGATILDMTGSPVTDGAWPSVCAGR